MKKIKIIFVILMIFSFVFVAVFVVLFSCWPYSLPHPWDGRVCGPCPGIGNRPW